MTAVQPLAKTSNAGFALALVVEQGPLAEEDRQLPAVLAAPEKTVDPPREVVEVREVRDARIDRIIGQVGFTPVKGWCPYMSIRGRRPLGSFMYLIQLYAEMLPPV